MASVLEFSDGAEGLQATPFPLQLQNKLEETYYAFFEQTEIVHRCIRDMSVACFDQNTPKIEYHSTFYVHLK